MGPCNYGDWKFWMRNFLIDAGLWCCVEPSDTVNLDLDKRALATINFSLKPSAAKITKRCLTAKDAWAALQKEYESTAVVRLIGLYSSLFRTRFEIFSTMQQYVDHILNIVEQLEAIGQPFADNVIGAIILACLPDQIRPLILGIQGSKKETTVEFIKSLLFQENIKTLYYQNNEHNETAIAASRFNGKNQEYGKKDSKPPPRCYDCNQLGHISKFCTARKIQLKKEHANITAIFAITNFDDETEWFIDSGSTAHLTKNEDWLLDCVSNCNTGVGVADGKK